MFEAIQSIDDFGLRLGHFGYQILKIELTRKLKTCERSTNKISPHTINTQDQNKARDGKINQHQPNLEGFQQHLGVDVESGLVLIRQAVKPANKAVIKCDKCKTSIGYVTAGCQVISTNTYQASVEGFQKHLGVDVESGLALIRQAVKPANKAVIKCDKCKTSIGYVTAGCQVISTNTYQASVEGFQKHLGVDVESGFALIRQAVTLANKAVIKCDKCKTSIGYVTAGCQVISTNTYQASVEGFQKHLGVDVESGLALIRQAVKPANKAVIKCDKCKTSIGYVTAGCQVISTNTYQASVEGFQKHLGVDVESGLALIRQAVKPANKAVIKCDKCKTSIGYVTAGCQVISTNTYQASVEGFQKHLGVDVVFGLALIRQAVKPANKAVIKCDKCKTSIGYVTAGCQVISTNTYQASVEGFQKHLGVDVVFGLALIRQAVKPANKAVIKCDKCKTSIGNINQHIPGECRRFPKTSGCG
ncbi:hypothetical protein J6590_050046 [Homalodisca vitripennis]|nr:hypothetical protein J6590_050046 [Homalodisca vitripennis]